MIDKLVPLAWSVVNAISPRQQDREDAYQTAYLAGLQATRVAEQNGSRTSSDILFKRMQQAVYREINKTTNSQLPAAFELREDDATYIPHGQWELKDELKNYLPTLTDKQRRAISLVYGQSLSVSEAARREGVIKQTMSARVQSALGKMRDADDSD